MFNYSLLFTIYDIIVTFGVKMTLYYGVFMFVASPAPVGKRGKFVLIFALKQSKSYMSIMFSTVLKSLNTFNVFSNLIR